jgi:hypothetical protein
MGSSVPIDDLIRLENPLLVALAICEQGMGTKGQPPRARVRVTEVLHGSLALVECDSMFPPDNDESWYAIRAGDDALEQWKQTPYASPETGATIVAAAVVKGDVLEVWPRSIRPDDESARAHFRALFEETA